MSVTERPTIKNLHLREVFYSKERLLPHIFLKLFTFCGLGLGYNGFHKKRTNIGNFLLPFNTREKKLQLEMINGGNQHMVVAEKIDCAAKCKYRCSKSWKHKMCIKTCNTCCQRCNCVPPGTVGNKEVCPCYAKMTTHGGRPKCP
ncbi:hypothetical protein L6164_007295 [Bauhinia variegata]|uniref:Uncharacterized protein n=1 Tax=Bauhinia variegata TaxID=167791 RepID=A0ACB9PDB0_BAUVA|nr:hypothetical protein L6164_007295 [Bauhinia variegata]